MALNDPRTIPYDFRVVACDGLAWLIDDSERTYLCEATPSIYATPLYALDSSDIDIGDATYLREAQVRDAIPLELDPEDIAADVDEVEAWDTAREEAHANHVL